MTVREPVLTLRRLEDHLWQAADLFRNKGFDQRTTFSPFSSSRGVGPYSEEFDAALKELGDVPPAEELAHDRAFHVL